MFSKTSVEIFVVDGDIPHHLLESQWIEYRYDSDLSYQHVFNIVLCKILLYISTHHDSIDLIAMHTTTDDEMFARISSFIGDIGQGTRLIFVLKDYFFMVHRVR